LFIVHCPALWVDAAGTFNGIIGLAAFLSANPVRPTFFEGQYVLNHGPEFYPAALVFRLTPIVMIGLVIALIAGVIEARRRRQEARGTRQEAGSQRQEAAPDLASCLWLLAFSFLFMVFITPVAKKYDRYLLPALTMLGSDLVGVGGMKTIEDPYTGATLAAVPALFPDVAILHVHRAEVNPALTAVDGDPYPGEQYGGEQQQSQEK
jgi:hypothetical protein